jgi:hypothetical protein
MISSALYRFFGMVQISSGGFLPLLIWTRNFRLGHCVSFDMAFSDIFSALATEASRQLAAAYLVFRYA